METRKRKGENSLLSHLGGYITALDLHAGSTRSIRKLLRGFKVVYHSDTPETDTDPKRDKFSRNRMRNSFKSLSFYRTTLLVVTIAMTNAILLLSMPKISLTFRAWNLLTIRYGLRPQHLRIIIIISHSNFPGSSHSYPSHRLSSSESSSSESSSSSSRILQIIITIYSLNCDFIPGRPRRYYRRFD